MEIIKTYKGEGIGHSKTVEEAIECLEKRGFYKPGTVKEIIAQGKNVVLQTDWAFWSFEF